MWMASCTRCLFFRLELIVVHHMDMLIVNGSSIDASYAFMNMRRPSLYKALHRSI